jgi:uncharacterized protein YhbP (UPF0306 family)
MNEKVNEILSGTRYATISTVDKNGKAWAAPVWYTFDDQHTLYWWSSQDSQHSQNIYRNNEIYITIFNSRASEGEGVGLYIRASAKEVPNGELDKAIEIYNESTAQFKLSRENTTGNAPTRLYQAIVVTLQINDGEEINGFYRDIRRDVI